MHVPNFFKYFSAPYHGWLEVPKILIEELGIKQNITGYSYVSKDNFYLEEDYDASQFFEAMKAKGWSDQSLRSMIRNEDINEDNFICKLPHYEKI